MAQQPINPVMGDINRMNRFNTSFGGRSVNRPAAMAQTPQPTQGKSGGFFQTAQRYLQGFGKR